VIDQRTPVIIAARRTPITTSGRGLAGLTATDLAAQVLSDLRSTLPERMPAPEDVIIGMARGPGGNPARVATLAAGWPNTTPAVTIDRQCGAGLDALCLAAAEIGSGQAGVVIAGGAESASRAEPGRSPFAPESLGDPDMGPAAEDLAAHRGITRTRQDDYALRSHQRAMLAQHEGRFNAELVSVPNGVDDEVVARDDRPRSMRSELLERMPPAFVEGGSVTAGNSCPVSDGAAAVVMVSESIRATLSLPGLAILGCARAGVDPRWPGLGPVPAVREVCAQTGIGVDELDRIEITEAFAAQVLAVLDELHIAEDDPRVCADGGAIALGHPWGASGTVLAVRLFSALRSLSTPGRRARGLATCAIGGGQGVAMIVEWIEP